ncbi:MAG: hypothetical protein Q8R40_01655 [bacterium]|nr:hypothetical protein [bacterium]
MKYLFAVCAFMCTVVSTTIFAQELPQNMSWRHLLIPEVQEITDRVLELYSVYEAQERALPQNHAMREFDALTVPEIDVSLSRMETIAANAIQHVIREYNGAKKAANLQFQAAPDCTAPLCGNLTEKDIADMMYCRFGHAIGRCPRPEFLNKR